MLITVCHAAAPTLMIMGLVVISATEIIKTVVEKWWQLMVRKKKRRMEKKEKTTTMICDYADDVGGDEELRGDDGRRVYRL